MVGCNKLLARRYDDEAELVREVFERFQRVRSLVALAAALNDEGRTTKWWVSGTGRVHGGRPMTQKYVHRLLTNPVYIGKIVHRRGSQTEVYDGRHEPIIEQAEWDRVQKLMDAQDRDGLHRWTHAHLLKGKLRTAEGFAVSPTSTQRPVSTRTASGTRAKQKRLVRYYISQKAIKHGFKTCPLKSLNAEHLDDLVRGVVLGHLDHGPLDAQQPEVRDPWIRAAIKQVTLSDSRVTIDLDRESIDALQSHEFRAVTDPAPAQPVCSRTCSVEDRGEIVRLSLDIQIKRHDGRRLLLSPDGEDLVIPSKPEPKQHLVDAVGLAYRWHDELLKSRRPIRELAREVGVDETRIHRLLPLVYLGPNVLEAILMGSHSPRITLADLLHAAKLLDWAAQERHLGIVGTA